MASPISIGLHLKLPITSNAGKLQLQLPWSLFFASLRKRQLAVLVLVCLFPIGAASGREQTENSAARSATPKAAKLDSTARALHDVFFINEQRGWLLGADNGQSLIFGSTNSGKSWQERFQSPDALAKIKFANEKIGWSVGSNGTILHTFDGGLSWTRQRSGTKAQLAGLAVIDALTAWVTGADGTLLYTVDGGDNWQKREIKSQVGISDITFVDAAHGWAVGYGTILSTIDGGETWALKSSGDWKPLASVSFADQKRGWISVGAVVLMTENGGESWETVVPQSQGKTAGLSFVDSQHGWLATSRGREGSVAAVPGREHLSSESFILSTKDGGTTWEQAAHFESAADHSAWVLDVFFVNRYRGWAVGREGLILRTVDSGESWEKMQPALARAARPAKQDQFVPGGETQSRQTMLFLKREANVGFEQTSASRSVEINRQWEMRAPSAAHEVQPAKSVRVTPEPSTGWLLKSDSRAPVASGSSTSGSRQERSVPAGFAYSGSHETIQFDVEFKSKSLAGLVTDPSGAPRANVLIERLTKNWGERIEAVFTDANGYFAFRLETGTHFLRISMTNFNTMLVRVKAKATNKAPKNLAIELQPSQ